MPLRRITETAAGPAALVVDDMQAPGAAPSARSTEILALRKPGNVTYCNYIVPRKQHARGQGLDLIYPFVITREFRFGADAAVQGHIRRSCSRSGPRLGTMPLPLDNGPKAVHTHRPLPAV